MATDDEKLTKEQEEISAAWEAFWSLPEKERIKRDMHYAAFKDGGDNVVIEPYDGKALRDRLLDNNES